jgi:YVTN family beta-propeller protein
MNKINSILIVLVATTTIFSSCDNENGPNELPLKTSVTVVNEGNYGAGSGSVSFYDEEQMTIQNNVVKNANNDAEIGATVQSMYQNEGIGYIVCNGPDKIEFINTEDYTFLANPETNISQPRYMTSLGNIGYITCWGPWDYSNYSLPNSYIAVMDLTSMTIVDTLECGSGPEGIIAVGNKLYVANSFEMSVSVIDPAAKTSSKINLISSPEHFALDASGKLWVSVSSGLYAINPGTGQKTDSLDVTNIDGKMAIDGAGEKIYLLTAEPWDATKSNIASEVRVFITKSKTLDSTPLITGEDFYGIGFNKTTSKIYVADSKAFAGPGEIYVYDLDGKQIDRQTTSVGPNGFVFK